MTRLALAALAFVTLASCKKDPEQPKAQVAAVTPAPAAKVEVADMPNATLYPFSQADSKLTWVGAKISMKHPGGFNTFSGLIELPGEDLTKGRVRADIDMASVFTDSEKLIGHLKTADFFDVAQFPRATFVSESISPNEGGGFSVSGTFNLHGVSKRITFPAKIALADGGVSVDAEFVINRKDFGIVYPGKPDDLIADDVTIKLELRAKKKA